jgi:hypothetical protein
VLGVLVVENGSEEAQVVLQEQQVKVTQVVQVQEILMVMVPEVVVQVLLALMAVTQLIVPQKVQVVLVRHHQSQVHQ